MNNTNNYGLDVSNPILMNSVSASIAFLNNLVTEKGYNHLYHRKGSQFYKAGKGISRIFEHPVDHYQLFDVDKKYHDIYISIYADECVWIPPVGFLFESFELNFEDENDHPILIEIDEKYQLNLEIDIETLFDEPTPPLGESIIENFGINGIDFKFPEGVLKSYLKTIYSNYEERFEKLKDLFS